MSSIASICSEAGMPTRECLAWAASVEAALAVADQQVAAASAAEDPWVVVASAVADRWAR